MMVSTFGAMRTNNRIWPVILVPYNLPPWLCMKQPNSILSMIIPGPRMVGNNIDVYLQPLIKELNELWSEGVQTFDSSKNEILECGQLLCGQLVIFRDSVSYLVGKHILVLHVHLVILT